MCNMRSESVVAAESAQRTKYGSSEKWRILKNVVVVSMAFMLQFTAFQGAANLQSSVNIEAGLGTSSLATIYAALIFSNMFLPVIMIKWIGCKYTIAVSFVTYMPYIAAQFWPRFYTLIPAALSVGFGGGPLWVAKCTYLTVASEAYEVVTGISAEVIVVRFFGIFFMIFQLAQVWGNLISSLVLTSGNSTMSSLSAVNASLIPSVCGSNFVSSSDAAEALVPQPPAKIQTIAGIYLACMCGACVLVVLALDSLTRYDSGRKSSGTGLSGGALLAITMKLLKETDQLLIIPITMWLGLGQAFVGADFTSAFVSCALGTGSIGFVMICYGICNSASAILLGSLVKLTGRLPVVLGAFILQAALIITLLNWRLHPEQKVVFFVISGLWGVCDGVWLVQINALAGIIFPGREEASYSNFRLWESMGFIVAYIYSPLIRTYVKLYILLVLLVIGIVCYFILEVRQTKKKKIEKETQKEDSDLDMKEIDLGSVNEGFNKIE